MRLLFYSCPSVFTYVLLVLTACADGQLLAPLMSLASNLNPFNGIASSLTGGVGAGGAGGLRGGLLSSLRGAASSGVGFSALPGGVRNMPIMPAPVAAPSLPFAGFGNLMTHHYLSLHQLSFLLLSLYDSLSLLLLIFRQANLIPALEQ